MRLSGGGKSSDIHRTFFAKMSNGSVRLLVKSSEALAAFSKNASFCEATRQRKERLCVLITLLTSWNLNLKT